jgi:hypothetical protein
MVYIQILFGIELIMFVVTFFLVAKTIIISMLLRKKIKSQNPKLFQEMYGWNLSLRLKKVSNSYDFFKIETDEYGNYKKSINRSMWAVGILVITMMTNFALIIIVAYIARVWK